MPLTKENALVPLPFQKQSTLPEHCISNDLIPSRVFHVKQNNIVQQILLSEKEQFTSHELCDIVIILASTSLNLVLVSKFVCVL